MLHTSFHNKAPQPERRVGRGRIRAERDCLLVRRRKAAGEKWGRGRFDVKKERKKFLYRRSRRAGWKRGALLIGALVYIFKKKNNKKENKKPDCSLSSQKRKMYEIWKQFNQIWLYLSLIQDILCVCLRRYFLYVIRTCSNDWSLFFLFQIKSSFHKLVLSVFLPLQSEC